MSNLKRTAGLNKKWSLKTDQSTRTPVNPHLTSIRAAWRLQTPPALQLICLFGDGSQTLLKGGIFKSVALTSQHHGGHIHSRSMNEPQVLLHFWTLIFHWDLRVNSLALAEAAEAVGERVWDLSEPRRERWDTCLRNVCHSIRFQSVSHNDLNAFDNSSKVGLFSDAQKTQWIPSCCYCFKNKINTKHIHFKNVYFYSATNNYHWCMHSRQTSNVQFH